MNPKLINAGKLSYQKAKKKKNSCLAFIFVGRDGVKRAKII